MPGEPRLRAIRSPSAGGEVNNFDHYLSGAAFYTKKPIRGSLRGPSLVYANVLGLLKPRRDKQERPRRHVFGCKRNVPFNCMLHLHMHHFVGVVTTLRCAPARRRQTTLRADAPLCKLACGDTTAAPRLIRSPRPFLLKAIFYIVSSFLCLGQGTNVAFRGQNKAPLWGDCSHTEEEGGGEGTKTCPANLSKRIKGRSAECKCSADLVYSCRISISNTVISAEALSEC